MFVLGIDCATYLVELSLEVMGWSFLPSDFRKTEFTFQVSEISQYI